MKRTVVFISAVAALAGCGGNQPDSSTLGGTNFNSQPGRNPAETAAKAYLTKGSGAATLASANMIGLKAFAHAAKDAKENVVFSPLTLAHAAGLALNGAGGETKSQIIKALSIEKLRTDDVNLAFKMLPDILEAQDGIELKLATALWIAKDVKLEDDFGRIARSSFGVAISDVDPGSKEAVAAVNKWFADKTGGAVRAAVSEADTTGKLLLGSALQVSCTWQLPFSSNETKTGDFHVSADEKVSVGFMSKTAPLGYLKTDNAEILRLPYKGGSTALYVVIPTGERGKMLAELTQVNWSKWVEEIKPTTLAVSLPKVKLQALRSIEADLKTSGIGLTEGADLSAIAKSKPQVKSVKQAVTFALEEGDAPAQPASPDDQPEPKVKVVANKPFVLLVAHEETKTILLVAMIAKP